MSIVYRLLFPSGKSYIGQTIKPLNYRISGHVCEARKDSHNRKICNAFNKYGRIACQSEILFESTNQDEINEKEQEYIRLFDSISNGYNSSIGGESGCLGYKHSPSTIERFKETRKGTKNSMFGKSRPDLAARNRSLSGTEEVRLRASQASAHALKKTEKIWQVTTPLGEIKIVKNIAAYCREHNLISSCMSNVAAGRHKTHKGYKCQIFLV